MRQIVAVHPSLQSGRLDSHATDSRGVTMKYFAPGLFIAAMVYGLFVVLVFLRQDKMVFFPDYPSRQLYEMPANVGLKYESVSLVTDDGVNLHGWYLPRAGASKVLLFFHGNAGNISHRLDSLILFHELGLNVLIFDYRGYGQSEGRPSEQGTYRDAEAAWRFLLEQKGFEAREVILFGRSLGGAVAANLAMRHTGAGVILESSFTSVEQLAKKYYAFLPVRWISRIHYDTASIVSRIGSPILIVHSREDEIIPFEHGQALFALASEPKRFLEIHGSHDQGFYVSGETYRQGLREFLHSLP